MKKLIIALGAVAVAMGVQAANINWGTGTTYFGGAGSELKDTSGTIVNENNCIAYIFEIGAGDYSTWNAQAGEAGAKTMFSVFAADTSGEFPTATLGTYSSNDAWYMEGGEYSFADAGITGSKNTPSYAAIVVTHLDENGNIDYYSANVVAGTPVNDYMYSNYTAALGWGTDAAGTATTWIATATPTPEPTSGLLLLLGVAGLALKRKRA